jgi:HAMP domain-containing protein
VEFTPTTVGWLVLAAILLAAVAIIVAGLALYGQRKVKRAYQAFSMGSRDDVLTLLQRHIDEVGLLRGDVRGLRRFADEIRDLHRGAVSHVGTVRYDAFDDMGGRLSFSTALLDEQGDGVVLTAINGRTDTRSYAKPIAGWQSRHNLSAEEEAAIQRARSGTRGGSRRRPQPEPPSADQVRRRTDEGRLREAPADAS